jgi:hypothetical protein
MINTTKEFIKKFDLNIPYPIHDGYFFHLMCLTLKYFDGLEPYYRKQEPDDAKIQTMELLMQIRWEVYKSVRAIFGVR